MKKNFHEPSFFPFVSVSLSINQSVSLSLSLSLWESFQDDWKGLNVRGAGRDMERPEIKLGGPQRELEGAQRELMLREPWHGMGRKGPLRT